MDYLELLSKAVKAIANLLSIYKAITPPALAKKSMEKQDRVKSLADFNKANMRKINQILNKRNGIGLTTLEAAGNLINQDWELTKYQKVRRIAGLVMFAILLFTYVGLIVIDFNPFGIIAFVLLTQIMFYPSLNDIIKLNAALVVNKKLKC